MSLPIEQRLADAARLAQAGRAEEAITALRAVLAIEPQRLDAALNLGFALAANGSWNEAREIFATVLASRPNALAARRALVRGHLQSGDAEAALLAARHPSLLDEVGTLAEVLADFASANALTQHAELLQARALRHPQD
jgi:tetratricopeptide (TPR) repeat protein